MTKLEEAKELVKELSREEVLSEDEQEILDWLISEVESMQETLDWINEGRD